MLAPYILGSEMSIVGPPPSYLGGVFFCKKTALGSTLRSGTEGYMTHYAYVCRESAHRDEGSPLGSPIGGRAKPLAAARRVTESW